jgi:cyclic pyranopterin phosphate synthase
MDNEINTEGKLTHVDRSGQASMVDVSEKKASTRRAVATGFVAMIPSTLALIKANNVAKGDVLATARIAGIQGAKQCPSLIPLCHPLMLSKVAVDFEIDDNNSRVNIRCECKLVGTTGVEMEALTGVSVAALTIFDMCKAADPNMLIGNIKVLSKEGGKTGDWRRTEA